MRVFRVGAAALFLAAATAACNSGDTGAAGGWRVSGSHTAISGLAENCPTPDPVLDSFEHTPTPNPSCSPPATTTNHDESATGVEPSPSPSAPSWKNPRVESFHHSSGWTTIYTTYTAPPATDIYVPAVHATTQPMPTPFTTPTPQPTRTGPSVAPIATQAPVSVPSAAAATP